MSATSEPRTSTVAQPVPELYLTGREEDDLHQGPDLHHPVLVGGLADVGPGLLPAHSARETQAGPGYNILACCGAQYRDIGKYGSFFVGGIRVQF